MGTVHHRQPFWSRKFAS